MQIFRTHITKDNSDGFPPRFPIEPRKNELVECPDHHPIPRVSITGLEIRTYAQIYFTIAHQGQSLCLGIGLVITTRFFG